MTPKEINDNILALMKLVDESRPRLTEADMERMVSLDEYYPVTVWTGGYPRPEALDEDYSFGVFKTSGSVSLD